MVHNIDDLVEDLNTLSSGLTISGRPTGEINVANSTKRIIS